MANRVIRDPRLCLPGDVSQLPQTTDRRAYQALQKLDQGTVSTSAFPLSLTTPVSTDILRFDGTNWINASFLPGPFGLGKHSPSSQLLTLAPAANQSGLNIDLAAGAGQAAVLIRDSGAGTLFRVSASGSLLLQGGAACVGDLTASGSLLVLHDLATSGAAVIAQGLTVNGSAQLGGAVTIGAAGLTVIGGGSFAQGVGFQSSVTVSGALTTLGGFTATAGLTASGLLLALGDCQVDGSLFVFGGVNVTGATQLVGPVTIGAAGLVLKGGASFAAGVGFTGSVTVSGDLTVRGGLATQSGITASGLLLALSNAEVDGNLQVLGSATLASVVTQSTLMASGQITGAGALQVWGATTLLNNLMVSGSLTTIGRTDHYGVLNAWNTLQAFSTLAATGLVTHTMVDAATGAVTTGLQLAHLMPPGSPTTQAGFGVGIQFQGLDNSNGVTPYGTITMFANNPTSGSLGTAFTISTYTGNVLTEQFRIRNNQCWARHDLQIDGNVGFYSTSPVARPTVSGSRGSNAALASLLTALASQGLVVDSST